MAHKESIAFIIFTLLTFIFSYVYGGYGNYQLKEEIFECPKLSAFDGLDFKKLEGEWWELITVNYHNKRTETHSCTVSRFDVQVTSASPPLRTYKSSVLIQRTTIASIHVTEDFSTNRNGEKIDHNKLKWRADQNSDSPLGSLIATRFVPNEGEVSFRYEIVDTDYKNYIIAYTCRPYKTAKANMEGAVVLTKKKSLTKEEIKSIEKDMLQLFTTVPLMPSMSYSIKNNGQCADAEFITVPASSN